MKRRLFQTILALAMTLGMIGTNVCASTLAETADTSADGVIVNETIEYLPDGSSIVITVIDETSIMPLATTFTKTGSKVYSARNPDGVIMWQFTVHGTFSVNSGVSATCTAASHSSSRAQTRSPALIFSIATRPVAVATVVPATKRLEMLRSLKSYSLLQSIQKIFKSL